MSVTVSARGVLSLLLPIIIKPKKTAHATLFVVLPRISLSISSKMQAEVDYLISGGETEQLFS